MADRLTGIAEELYAVPPAAFVAARNARATDLGRDDRALADAVRALRKPAPAAWVVNLLARERRAELDALLELGVAARGAQESLDRAELTRLGRELRTRVAELAREGLALAGDAALPAAVRQAVVATLDAGAADPDAAEAIRSGRLVRALQTIGFEPVDLAEAVAVPTAGSRAAEPRAAPERPRLRAVDDSDAELVRARARADAVLTHADGAAAQAAEELTAIETRLRAARQALAAAQREADALARDRDEATAALERARAAADVARTRRRALGAN